VFHVLEEPTTPHHGMNLFYLHVLKMLNDDGEEHETLRKTCEEEPG